MPRKSVDERFWEKVNTNGPVPQRAPELGPCWIWEATTNQKGYGQFWDSGKLHSAHRWIFQRHKGDLPSRIELDHRCFIHECVRLTHLRPATRYQNQQNRRGANRQSRSKERNVYHSGPSWLVQMTKNGKYHYIGRYATKDEAIAAAAEARNRLGIFA